MDLGSAEGGLDAVEDICKRSYESCKFIYGPNGAGTQRQTIRVVDEMWRG